MMTSKELRKKFLKFFEKNGHKITPSSSLMPPDTSVLFTTAGMQQFALHLEGKKDALKEFGSRHLTVCQKCFRSDDIEEIGDDTHHTFFEMLGNWSIGQNEKGEYFKEQAIKYALEFLVDELKFDKNKLYPTIFKGNKDISKDEESKKIWQKNGILKEKIKEFGEEDNLWGPVGEVGVCGPNSEIFFDRGEKFGCNRKDCGPNCPHCQRFIEIWNLVFIQYYKDKNKKYQLLPQKSVDTGMGLERVAAILQGKSSAYETDLFFPIIQEIEKLSAKKYDAKKKNFRIIADHIRGAVFLISEGILPSNVEQGYVLRRLLRRAMRHGKILESKPGFLIPLAQKIIEIYKDIYPEVQSKQADILTVIQKEEEKFEKALAIGINEAALIVSEGDIKGKQAFDLYQTYGFPIEMIKELAKEKRRKVDEKGFYEELKKHQEISRAGKEKKFGGRKEFSAELHTATHLLHSALRQVLGEQVRQMGSDITLERLRFDFSFERKMTQEELKKVEDLVNQKIKQDLVVKKQEMSYEEALKSNALAFFRERYPKKVSVYSIGDFSKEICAGPHAAKTGNLGRFKIVKEQSSSAGVRRIKAILE
jgi:alanyl-tRNA synthetase